MAGQDEREGAGKRRRGRGPGYFLLMTAIVIGVILVALHMLHRIESVLP